MNVQPSIVNTMLILCKKRQTVALADELDDWKDEGARVILYGETDKGRDGFLLLRWEQPIPARFREKMRIDEDVLDYVVLNNITTIPIARIPPQL